ncbi:glycosyltransferase family protein [Mycolicibacterium neoaurum]|uniref:Spore protein YkvP/CgeB glycosyl transferase-like domain-containing protein n=1 Tax=Mycolicibacterium neoaurum TaxID=1795 RepID=A0AAV2WRH8_MYCNE|nr:glycosyltransferase family 1 protein [Mycolicibacterium neoaurum]CDQ46944.1 hypothetical protein BN1047_04858 [Mycolicibacterium neoaurum]
MKEGPFRAKALLITPSFFGYERDIVAELERQGFQTTFLDERPSNGSVLRAVLRVRRGLVKDLVEKYYREQWQHLALEPFQLIIVIKAEVVPGWFLDGLRQANPGARMVFYSWDAISSVKNCTTVFDYFDELFSFDSDDVEKWDRFEYLPLFYCSEFDAKSDSSRLKSRKWELSFVGTLHSERYLFAQSLFARRRNTFGFFYVQARWLFAIEKYVTRKNSHVPWGSVSFRKLSRKQVAQIFRASQAVLDMPRDGQSGLTIRTFEVLASGAALVTTNTAITREPFYDPKRIVVLPGSIGEIDLQNLSKQLETIDTGSGPPPCFEQYSLSSWVRRLSGPKSPAGISGCANSQN